MFNPGAVVNPSKMASVEQERKMIEAKYKIELNSKMDDTDSRSEVASFSYEAREKGCYAGMYLGAALQLCPDLGKRIFI